MISMINLEIVTDALEFAFNASESKWVDQKITPAIAICEAALAEPSEPVAWLGDGGSLWLRNTSPYSNGRGQPLFTHPASKPEPLPELTDDEIVVLYAGQPQCDADMVEFAREVLAAAREKAK